MGHALEIFDKFGTFQLPGPEAIAALDPPTRKRFEAVRKAALASESAIEATKQAQRNVTAAMQAVATASAELNAARPKVSAIDAARAWIATTR